MRPARSFDSAIATLSERSRARPSRSFTADGRLDDAFVLRPQTNFRCHCRLVRCRCIRCVMIGGARTSARTNGAMSPRRAGLAASCCRCPPAEPRFCMPLTIVLSSRERSTSHRTGSRLPRPSCPRVRTPGHLYRLDIGVPGTASVASALLARRGVPSARVAPGALDRRSGSPGHFSIDTAGLLRTPDGRSEVLLMARDEQSQLTGDGWSAVDFDVVGPYRWMTASDRCRAAVVDAPQPQHVRLQALQRPHPVGPTRLALRLNETMLPRAADINRGGMPTSGRFRRGRCTRARTRWRSSSTRRRARRPSRSRT